MNVQYGLASVQRLLSARDFPDGIAHEDLDALVPRKAGEAAAVLRKVGLAFDQSTRLRTLAPIREYVRRKHTPVPKDLDRATNHYMELARKGYLLGQQGGAEASRRLVQELANLDSMISKGLERTDPEPAILAALALGEFTRLSGWGAQDLLEKAIFVARSSGRQQFEAKCANSLGLIALVRSDYDAARARLEEALPLFQKAGDVLGEADCIWSLGEIALRLADYDAANARFEEALPLFRNGGDAHGEANSIQRLGDIALGRAEHDAAQAKFEEALPLFRTCGNVLGEANCIRGLGNIALAHSDLEAAHTRLKEALSLHQNIGDMLGEANCILGLGDIAIKQSDFETAGARFREALRLYERIPEPYSIGHTYRRLARLEPEGSEERRRHVRAAREAWESIKRADLVELFLKEFGEDFEEDPSPSLPR